MGTNTVMVHKVIQKAGTSNSTLTETRRPSYSKTFIKAHLHSKDTHPAAAIPGTAMVPGEAAGLWSSPEWSRYSVF